MLDMEIATTLVRQGGTLYMRIPPVLVKHLNVKEGETMIVQDEEGKYGPFFSAWKIKSLDLKKDDIREYNDDYEKEEGKNE